MEKENRKKRPGHTKNAGSDFRRSLSPQEQTLYRARQVFRLVPDAAPSRFSPVARIVASLRALDGRDSQQRELLPIHTAFPFNSPCGETIAATKIGFSRQEASESGGIFARRTSKSLKKPSETPAGHFRTVCVRLWHGLCDYLNQLRHSNRSEVSSFI